MNKIFELAKKYEGYIIEKRREFHAMAELSYEEFKTTEMIIKELEDMGIEVTTFENLTGCIGTIHGKAGASEKEGVKVPVIMIRGDIDALPITECTDLDFKPESEGVMHACGHDNHIAITLGAAKILTEMVDELKGDVKFLFQPAEEVTTGAKSVIEKGALDGVDAVIGLHVWGTLDAPLISVEEGNRMASNAKFKIRVYGKKAHGSAPHLGNDAIVASASVITNLQTYVSRRNNPLNPLVLSIGTINGGTMYNIISDYVEMEGTIRTYSKDLIRIMQEELREIIENTSLAHNCRSEFECDLGLPALINEDEELNAIAKSAALKLFGEAGLGHLESLMASEDFAVLTEKVRGFYGFLGVRNEAEGKIYSNHHEKFDVDESVLFRGSAWEAQVAIDFLESCNL